MANPSVIDGGLHVNGPITCKDITLPNSSVSAAKIEAGAGIEYTKNQQNHRAQFSQPNTAATAETRAVAVVHGATGTSLHVKAGCVSPCTGDATITVDVKKNGTTILNAPISLSSAQAAYAVVSGTITVPALVVGDVLTVVTTVNIGTGGLGTGLFASFNWAEDPQ